MAGVTAAESMRAELRADLAGILYREPDEIPDDGDFTELGLDSILGLEFLALVNGRYGLRENIEAIYDHPTLDQLVEYLGGRTAAEATGP